MSGGRGHDRIAGRISSGRGSVQVIRGGAGRDRLYGGFSHDRVLGGRGADLVAGGGGSEHFGGPDRLWGGGGNDVLRQHATGSTHILTGGPGKDRIERTGGDGIIAAGYAGAPGEVYVDLSRGLARREGRDELIGIDGIVGSSFDDVLGGTAGRNRFDGRGGNDRLIGRGGDDSFIGEPGDDAYRAGPGRDHINFQGWSNGVSINLSTGTASGAGTDTIAEMEDVDGSFHDDVLIGNDSSNSLNGVDGDDDVSGGAGDDDLSGDRIHGEGGDDIPAEMLPAISGDCPIRQISALWLCLGPSIRLGKGVRIFRRQ